MELSAQLTPQAVRQMRFAMRLSLGFGAFLVTAKIAAYAFTGSAAILSDAAESVIHEVAVAFAAFSLWLSRKPADARFRYGYERIGYFSAGFEGALIALAAVYIIWAAVTKWMRGLELENLGWGTAAVVVAALVNLWLGLYLVHTGRRTRSIILEANGKHVLTDSWTSFGVVVGLGLVLATGWKPFDPLCAIAVALNILWSGGKLVWRSVRELMDYADPRIAAALRGRLDVLCAERGVQYHGLRFRNTGSRVLVDVHLLFPYGEPVGEAHRAATAIERGLPEGLDFPVEVVTHLEALEDHERIHEDGHFTGR